MARKATKTSSVSPVPRSRIRRLNAAGPRPDGDYVLYWMTAFRRTRHNHALQRAVEWAARLQRPLVILDALRVDAPWASDRIHRFVLQGMADVHAACTEAGVLHHPYVEPRPGAGKGLVMALAQRACVVVSDDSPLVFLPRARAAAAARVDVLLEAVEANGLVPLAAPGRAFGTAYAFRRWLQKTLPEHLAQRPVPEPLASARLPRLDALPGEILARWPAASPSLLTGAPGELARLPIDHGVPPVMLDGGEKAARAQLRRFVTGRLPRYDEDRAHPDRDAGSGLSPYLHFGQLSTHEVLEAVTPGGWSPASLKPMAGKREGFWQLPPSTEAFLDQLVTWRELGYLFAHHRGEEQTDYASLPTWARVTLEKHAGDPRPTLYALEQLEQARTGDALWNAAQRQLLREGTIHNALRMLWGKKILEWSPSPAEALRRLIALNDRWALDGRDPNSYSGIFWVLGRYDRPWGPERKIFGTVRYLSSENSARKWRVREYLRRYGEGG